jgi:hypothetical protein
MIWIIVKVWSTHGRYYPPIPRLFLAGKPLFDFLFLMPKQNKIMAVQSFSKTEILDGLKKAVGTKVKEATGNAWYTPKNAVVGDKVQVLEGTYSFKTEIEGQEVNIVAKAAVVNGDRDNMKLISVLTPGTDPGLYEMTGSVNAVVKSGPNKGQNKSVIKLTPTA